MGTKERLGMSKYIGDLISRQAAIDYLMTNMAWYNEDGYEESEDEKLNAITDLINGVPSAEPEEERCKWRPVMDGDGEMPEVEWIRVERREDP